VLEVLRGYSGGYEVFDTIDIRRGLARVAHDQAEHLTDLAMLFKDGLQRRRITRLVIFGIEFVSMLPVIESTTLYSLSLQSILHRRFEKPVTKPYSSYS
jgi:hypothetical protein